MRSAGVVAICVALPAVIGLQLADRPASDSYFESAFDGVWTGFLSYKIEGKDYKLFAVLNLNVQGNGGGGYALIPLPSGKGELDEKILAILNIASFGIGGYNYRHCTEEY